LHGAPTSASGLGRVKMLTGRSAVNSQSGGVSGCDGGDQWLDANNVHDLCQIIGQDGKCHLRGHFWKRLSGSASLPFGPSSLPNGCSTVSQAHPMEQRKTDRCKAAPATKTRLGNPHQAPGRRTTVRPSDVQLSNRRKLRGCDVLALKVEDVAPNGYTLDRATLRQKKTGRPVRFELTEATRQAIDDYVRQEKESQANSCSVDAVDQDAR
jgi:hypothetical protein